MSERSGETIIRLGGVTKRYGFGDSEYFALRDFDLTVKRGEFIMVMGPSGCGKTTLLNIIGLLDKATVGEYALGGKNVERISARRQARFRARQIGFIFQNFNLIPTLPVIENVALPLVYAGFHKTRRLKMASNILDHFHLQEREYYMPWQLSGGQQQRVAIARSLVANPSIILADEPTGNLDSRSSHIVMEELRDIHSMGNTIIMVTHNPALTTYATRVINMLDGEIDTDVKTVADRDLPRPGDAEKILVRVLPRKRGGGEASSGDVSENGAGVVAKPLPKPSDENGAGAGASSRAAATSSSRLSSQVAKSPQKASAAVSPKRVVGEKTRQELAGEAPTKGSTKAKSAGKKKAKKKKSNGKKIGVK